MNDSVVTKHVCCEHVPVMAQDERSLEQAIEYFRAKLEREERELREADRGRWW